MAWVLPAAAVAAVVCLGLDRDVAWADASKAHQWKGVVPAPDEEKGPEPEAAACCSQACSQRDLSRRTPVYSSPYSAGQMAGRMAVTASGRAAMMRRSVRRRLALDLTTNSWAGSLPKPQVLGSRTPADQSPTMCR